MGQGLLQLEVCSAFHPRTLDLGLRACRVALGRTRLVVGESSSDHVGPCQHIAAKKPETQYIVDCFSWMPAYDCGRRTI